MNAQKEKIEELATRYGYTVKFHDGLCDLSDNESRIKWLDAPLEDVIRYLDMPVNQKGAWIFNTLEWATKDIDSIIGCLECDSIPCHVPGKILLMHRTGTGPKWVLHISGTDLFHDFNSMMKYAAELCKGKTLTQKEYSALRQKYREHLKNGTPL